MNHPVSERAAVAHGNHDDAEYSTFLARVNSRFVANVGNGPVFTTDAIGLWEMYLNTFTGDDRQHHNCSACRQFIERFGGLVTIDEAGNTTPVIWNSSDAHEHYVAAVASLQAIVARAKVTGVFMSSDRSWGTPKTGRWHHLAVLPPKTLWHKDRALTAEQAMAAKRHDHETLQHALHQFSEAHLMAAVTLLKADALYRSEKVLGAAEWLLSLKRAFMNAPAHKRMAGMWRSVATSPAGFCHPRSSMIGTLLDDIAEGLPITDVTKKFKAKMHPLQYQRPQSAPSTGNIEQSEKLFEKLGLAPALRRRFARLDEVIAVWRPAPDAKPSVEGVFGHLKPKGPAASPPVASAAPMTWVKFANNVLPEALKIEALVPSHGNFTAFLTSVETDAPPIIQWDREDRRNPVSQYVYHGGSAASKWGLDGGSYVKVNALALHPAHWHGDVASHYENRVTAILDGAYEQDSVHTLGLFPEILKSDLHPVRSTIEAFSKNGTLEGRAEATACGLSGPAGLTLRVTTANGIAIYKLDRWD